MVPLWAVMLWLEVVVIAGTLTLLLLARRLGHGLLERLSSRRPAIGARVDRVRGAIERRGSLGLAVGRTTPGPRTLTVLVAALSTISFGVALGALVLGSSIFAQGHLLLGYAIGPPARAFVERLPLVAIGVSLLLAGIASPSGSPAGADRPAPEAGSRARVPPAWRSACSTGLTSPASPGRRRPRPDPR